MFKRDRKFLFYLFLLSFILRIIFFIFIIKDNPVVWRFDSRVYKEVAEQIVSGNGITNNDGSPHFYRVPGYSIFLAITSFGRDFTNSLFIQIFLSSFIPLLIFYLSRTLFPLKKLLSFFVSIFSSVYLGFVLFSGLALTETIFLILFLLFLLFFYKEKLFISGVFLGCASMFRPVGVYIIFVSTLIIFFLYKNKLWKTVSIFFGYLLVVFPWLLRNFIFTGVLFFTTLPGIHFLKHSAARIYMEINNTSTLNVSSDYMTALNKVSDEWNDSIKIAELKYNKKLNPAQICNLAEKISVKYFLKDFVVTSKHVFMNMFKTCFSLYSSELLFLDSGGKLPNYSPFRGIKSNLKRYLFPEVNNKFLIPIIYLEILFFLFLLIGFAGFIFNSFYIKQNFYVLLKVFPFIFLFVFITLSCGFARLRLPIEPFLILLSIEFWLKVFKKREVVKL